MTTRAAAKTILSTLSLTKSNKVNTTDKVSVQRSKLLKRLDEQILAVQAAVNNEDYYGTKTVKKVDEEGNEFFTTVNKRKKKWFYTNDGNDWFLEVKYGNRTLQLSQNKSAIAVGALDNMVAVIEKVKEAVQAGELDAAINAVLAKRK